MSIELDATHDPARRSRVESANQPGTDFPIQNLPFGVFRRSAGDRWRVGVAIGDLVLDVPGALAAGHLSELSAPVRKALSAPALNPLAGLGSVAWRAVRTAVSELLRAESPFPAPADGLLPRAAEVELGVPVVVGDYTDFYASIHHATNVGSMFRPDNPLLPNWRHVPIGYHGRSSSLVPSGTPVRRPQGQRKPEGADAPEFGPTRLLDYECEVGFVVGPGNRLGEPIPIGQAPGHIFGFLLVNDWSARDIQAWEYQPLGPFLGKSFATTLSPWIVTSDALRPFRIVGAPRQAGDPEPLAYLNDPGDRAAGGLGLALEVLLQSAAMRKRDQPPFLVSRAGFDSMYWTPAQMLAHHASNGCNLRPGDLLASGTVSGLTEESRGCLLERTWRGSRPLTLPSGETRKFLEDGDEVIMRGRCDRDGLVGIGFGECRGRVVEAR